MTAPGHLFPDNTVLINFAIIGEIQLLGLLLAGKGTWASAVAAECENSVRTGLYPSALASAEGVIAETLFPTQAEIVDARTIRNEIAAPDEPFPKSYGEAETIAIIVKRRLVAVVITDDGGVARYVKASNLGITVASTTDILAMAVRTNHISQEDAEAHIAALLAAGRHRISLKRFHCSLKS